MPTTARRTVWPVGRVLSLGILLAIVASAFFSAALIKANIGLRPGPQGFGVAAWEIRHFPGKWLYAFRQEFSSRPSIDEQNATLSRFFELTYEIDKLVAGQSEAAARGDARDVQQAAALTSRERERNGIQREAESVLQERLTSVIRSEGITRDLLFFPVVWPPVNFDFTSAPQTLVLSRRDRIALTSQRLLAEGLSTAQTEALEAEAEAGGEVSALAFPLGGFSTYPTLVDYGDDYVGSLQVIAHEWTHNYLFFRPLGFNYAKNNDLKALNETVADLVGHELAAAVVKRWPLPANLPPPPPPVADIQAEPQQPRPNVRAVLRQLRGDVDQLLAGGHIREAEALMAQKREELSSQGVRIRKINQAYFAFLNLYGGAAGSAAATNPIGPKVDNLRKQSGSLRSFLGVIGNLTSVSELDRALARPES